MVLHLLAAALSASASDHWAVLVAGSNGYMNYRHQADVCHAYQVVKNKGIPEEQIIVMAYDDIANSPENKFPGKLFNEPTLSGTPGKDVYAGCRIDWSGKMVTPDNFIKVLTGDTSVAQPLVEDAAAANAPNKQCSRRSPVACPDTGSCCCVDRSIFGCRKYTCCGAGEACAGPRTGCKKIAPTSQKVLNSTADSRVFVNFVDHGAVNLIAFPDGPTLHAKELVAALQKMHAKKMFKELVFYLEACESGSMFQTLPSGLGIYATTAANGKESSWGTYCSSNATVDGTNLGTCLGDLYSVKWMEDSDLGTPGETLEAQFQRVKAEVSKSHVEEFGDATTVGAEPLVSFQGDANPPLSMVASVVGPAKPTTTTTHDDVAMLDSRKIELVQTLDKFMATDDADAGEELIRLVTERMAASTRFGAIASAVTPKDLSAVPLPAKETDPDCHYAAHKAYVASCGHWTVGALKHSATLVKLCEETNGDAQPIVNAIKAACK